MKTCKEYTDEIAQTLSRISVYFMRNTKDMKIMKTCKEYTDQIAQILGRNKLNMTRIYNFQIRNANEWYTIRDNPYYQMARDYAFGLRESSDPENVRVFADASFENICKKLTENPLITKAEWMEAINSVIPVPVGQDEYLNTVEV